MRHLGRLLPLAALGLLYLSRASADPKPAESSFILMYDSSHTTMAGNLRDLERVRRMQQGNERTLWYRSTAGKQYLIVDPATLAQVETAWKAVQALSDQQSKLGAKQSALGAQQSKLGAKQSALEARQSPLETERETIAKRRGVLERQIHELEAQSRELDQQMQAFEKPMRELDKQMEVLDRKSDAAEKQAHAELDAIVARAIAAGVAKPFK
jgi:chromosome segregation ATPase